MVDQTAPSVKSRQAKRKDGSPRKAAKGGHGKSAAPRAAHAGARQHALSNVCQLALQSTAIDTFLNESAKAVAAALNIELVGVFELSDDEKVLRLAGRFGWPEEKSGEINVIPAAVCRPLYEALSANDAVKFEAAQFNVLPQSRNAAGNGMATAIGERSKRAGILTVHAKGRRRDFDESDASFLQTIAFIIAAVWERHGFEATLMQRNRALEALEQGVMITDARRLDDPLIYVNPAFERLTGYRTDEVIGKNPRFLQGSATDRNVVTNLRQGAAEGHSFRNTIVNYRKDGGEFWNDLTVSPVRDANDTTTHHVGILSDVTERVHLEEQLRQAQKMEAIGHLTGGIAHDFNNLLAVIIGNSEILLEDVTDDSLRDIAALVMKTAESGAVLTQRLLAFGRRQALSPEPFDVPKAIESLTDMLQRALGEQIRLVSRDDVSDRCAMVDRAQFESAILNLAVNARDAMPDGGELNIESKLVKGSDAGMPPELENGRISSG